MASTDPEAHSIHLDTHTPLTIEPADIGMSCSACYETYKDGDWRVLVTDARGRYNAQFTLCAQCARAIGAAVAQIPKTPAPQVNY